MAYLERGRLVLFPHDGLADVVNLFGVRMMPTRKGVLDLVKQDPLVELSRDGETVLFLVRGPLMCNR